MSFHDTMCHSNPVLILALTIRNSQALPCISLHSACGDSEADAERDCTKELLDRAGSLRTHERFHPCTSLKSFLVVSKMGRTYDSADFQGRENNKVGERSE